ESFTITSSSQDNFGIDREEWYADGILIQENNSGTDNLFTYKFSTLGNHSVELRVFDFANLSSSLTVNVTVQDRTPPVVDSIITGPQNVKAGEANTWRLNATDLELPSGLTWTWDFDRSVDSDEDGDTRNDVEASGDLVTWTFDEGGVYSITCTVTNEQGLTSTQELIVYVEDAPASSSSATDYILPVGGIVGAVVGAVFFIRWMIQRRSHEELMDQEAARIAEEEAQTAREPDHEEQLAMYQNRGGASSGFQRGGGDDMAQIAGVGAGYGAQQPQPTIRQSGVDDAALLSAFEEADSEPVPKPQPEPMTEPIPEKTQTQQSNVLSSGIELPNVMKESTTPSPSVTTPEPEPIVEETPPPVQQTTEVIGTCAECGQQYAVDMPLGIEQAQIDCPKCGNRSTIRR
ncbi:MAG: PKD domain-containing protein, partial [Candidatus Thermoplasmatota archaeon]|nr:PKD domain-containing protein [Candidatus Thermoplasmatota archaeon]